MTDALRKPLRALFRAATQLYPQEYGKYSLVMNLYFPHLAPRSPEKKIISFRNTFKMELELGEYLQAHLYLFGSFEPATVKILKSLVKSGDTVLDIGANVGYIALELATAVGASGCVFGFEADKHNFELFKRNAELNPRLNLHPVHLAISDSDKPLRLHKSLIEFNNGRHSTLPGENLSEYYDEIQADTVDRFLAQRSIEKLNVIKIDIEGAEMSAFKGMTDALARYRPIILSELCEEHQKRAGFAVQEVKAYLADKFQMRAFLVLESGKIRPVSMSENHITDNVVFLPNERVSEFQHLIANNS